LISALFERKRRLLDILRDDHFDPTFSPHPSPAVQLRPNVEDDCPTRTAALAVPF